MQETEPRLPEALKLYAGNRTTTAEDPEIANKECYLLRMCVKPEK